MSLAISSVKGYFAHAIYLLPGQMIPEHAHVKTKFPAKHESWMVQAKNITYILYDEIFALDRTMSSGDSRSVRSLVAEGAIVDEWACYHDNDGLRFTNTKAAL